MYKLKRTVSFFCCITLLLICLTPSTYATATNPTITPYMEHIMGGQCALNVSSTTATVNAWVQAYSDATKTEVKVELQEQYLFFFWTTVDSWSASSNDIYCRASGSSPITSGKTYRAVATVTAWVGSDSETQTITTESKTAP